MNDIILILDLAKALKEENRWAINKDFYINLLSILFCPPYALEKNLFLSFFCFLLQFLSFDFLLLI